MQHKGPQKLKSTALLGLEWPRDWHGFINHGTLVKAYVNKSYLNCHTIELYINNLKGTFQH